VGAILTQLGLDQTFFIQFILFLLVFLVVSRTYFKPFMKLLDARHMRTVADREAAEKLMAEAQEKFDAYRAQIQAQHAESRKELEQALLAAKAAEAEVLGKAREEAKRITQETSDALDAQKAQLSAQLETEVESLAQQISKTLLPKRD
jgi:F-type H+-transporting ATPase subunit b